MRRRSPVERRRIVFVGVEGESERAFARFLQRCCEDEGLHLHLDIRVTRGGDSLAVVEEAGRLLARHAGQREIDRRLVLLDRDRIDRDLRASRDAQTEASRRKLKIIFQSPNLEGLLLRLHPGCERRNVTAGDALAALRKIWPDYAKPATTDQLHRRFKLSDLRRAARHDKELHGFLAVLGLSRPDPPVKGPDRRPADPRRRSRTRAPR